MIYPNLSDGPITTIYLWGVFETKTVKSNEVEAFWKTTKMAAADMELSVEAAIASVLNELHSLFWLEEEQSTAFLKLFLRRKMFLP